MVSHKLMQNPFKPYMQFASIAFCLTLTSAGVVHAQSEATSLAESAYKNTDIQLNDIYQKIIKKIPSAAKLGFVETQRAWIVFRDLDAQCRAGISSQGGSSYSTDDLAILTELTAERVGHLKTLLFAL